MSLFFVSVLKKIFKHDMKNYQFYQKFQEIINFKPKVLIKCDLFILSIPCKCEFGVAYFDVFMAGWGVFFFKNFFYFYGSCRVISI